MSKAPIPALLLALILGGIVVTAPADAAPRRDEDASTGITSEALVLPKAAIAVAVRRTAVADPDLDGVVSRLEAAKYYETRFRLLDENRDGSIEVSEFLGAAAVRSLHGLDEFSKPRPLAFESVDVDGNSVVTPEEFLRAEVLNRDFAGLDARRQAVFEVVDANRDGMLSRQEFMAAGSRDFSGSDGDGDSKVSIWEFYGAARL
jgi:Ca2+-binding EF-hand superfamily protein